MSSGSILSYQSIQIFQCVPKSGHLVPPLFHDIWGSRPIIPDEFRTVVKIAGIITPIFFASTFRCIGAPLFVHLSSSLIFCLLPPFHFHPLHAQISSDIRSDKSFSRLGLHACHHLTSDFDFWVVGIAPKWHRSRPWVVVTNALKAMGRRVASEGGLSWPW